MQEWHCGNSEAAIVVAAAATAVVALAGVVMAAAVVPAKGSKRSKSRKCSCKNNDNKKVAILTMKLLQKVIKVDNKTF